MRQLFINSGSLFHFSWLVSFNIWASSIHSLLSYENIMSRLHAIWLLSFIAVFYSRIQVAPCPTSLWLLPSLCATCLLSEVSMSSESHTIKPLLVGPCLPPTQPIYARTQDGKFSPCKIFS